MTSSGSNQIKYRLDQNDIEWKTFKVIENNDTVLDKVDDSLVEYNKNQILALLLINDIVFINSQYLKKEWPEEARKGFYIGVICNDIFAWGCSDAEEIKFKDLIEVYKFFKKDPIWGTTIWAIIKRQQMPQAPVLKKINEAGIWNLDDLKHKHNLRNNYYDGIGEVLWKLDYELYSQHEISKGNDPITYSENWRKDFKEFLKEINLSNEEYQHRKRVCIEKWEEDNGFISPKKEIP